MVDLYISGILFGLGISGILFMVSIGISIGFGLMRIVNMEQMVYYTFGAYMTWALVASTGSFLLGLLGGTLVAACAGFIVETQLLRRVYGKELMFTMVVTFSVFMIGIGLVQYVFGLACQTRCGTHTDPGSHIGCPSAPVSIAGFCNWDGGVSIDPSLSQQDNRGQGPARRDRKSRPGAGSGD